MEGAEGAAHVGLGVPKAIDVDVSPDKPHTARRQRAERTVRVELPVVLPDVDHHEDQCVERLREKLSQRRGVGEAHLERDHGRTTLCLHYDADQLTLRDVTRAIERAGGEVTKRYRHESLWITGMDSPDAAAALEPVLRRLPGIVDVSVNYAAERARVEWDAKACSRKRILASIHAMGYRVEEDHDHHDHGHDHDHSDEHDHGHAGGHAHGATGLLMPLLSGTLLAAGYFGEVFFGLSQTWAIALYVGAYLAGGYDLALHGVRAAAKLSFDIEFLMVVAAVGAAILGEWPEGALLLFLFSLGHALEHMAMDRARNAIKALGQLTPRSARIVRDGQEMEVPVSRLLRGDIVVVRPAERIPIDGRILEGRSNVDQSPITGESVPLEKEPGSDVFAGTVNGEGSLRIEVTKLAKDTTLARVVQMVQEAQTQKSPTQRFTERFERRFVPIVLVSVVVVWAIPPLVAQYASGVPYVRLLALPASESFLRAMTILVAASPCALAISTPAAVLSGIAQAARHGVLFKGGAHLENLGAVRAIAFDKTGTITLGAPVVTDVVPVNRVSRERLLATAAAAEIRSGHPLARAIVARAKSDGIKFTDASELVAAHGRGITARLDQKIVRVGSGRLFNEEKVTIPQKLAAQASRLEANGRTIMFVQHGNDFLGVIGVADEPRPEAARVIQRLRHQGIPHLVMLTGDNQRVARSIAAQVGLQEVEADLLPEHKVDAIRRLQQRHGAVAMVGDGVNDAPAMANATLGIAMGAGGTDVALETADVALMADNIEKLPFAVALSRKSRSIIRQNLVLSLGVIALLVPSALLGVAGIGIAIILHEGSTLLVVFNALRLLRFQETRA